MNKIKIPIECEAVVYASRFDKMKSSFESENGAYEVSLVDDSETIDFFYAEDIDFI